MRETRVPGLTSRRAVLLGAAGLLSGCATGEDVATSAASATAGNALGAPSRITIRPDDYHVPYAGTAADGRRFFLSAELLDMSVGSFVGLFLWNADGSFSDIKVDQVGRASGLPPAQAAPGAGSQSIVSQRLAELGAYVLGPITVEPFLRIIDGVEFGWKYEVFEGLPSVHIEPGNFIAYYPPWDGYGYDT